MMGRMRSQACPWLEQGEEKRGRLGAAVAAGAARLTWRLVGAVAAILAALALDL